MEARFDLLPLLCCVLRSQFVSRWLAVFLQGSRDGCCEFIEGAANPSAATVGAAGVRALMAVASLSIVELVLASSVPSKAVNRSLTAVAGFVPGVSMSIPLVSPCALRASRSARSRGVMAPCAVVLGAGVSGVAGPARPRFLGVAPLRVAGILVDLCNSYVIYSASVVLGYFRLAVRQLASLIANVQLTSVRGAASAYGERVRAPSWSYAVCYRGAAV